MFYDNGLKFSCNRCSDCCRLSPGVVYLTYDDLHRLCAKFQLEEDQFISMYCRWLWYVDNTEVLCLKEMKNYDCVLWKKECGCTAYEARPLQCSTYPFWSWMIEDKETWDSCAKDCPGINAKDGKIWTKEQIEEQSSLYDSIEPVHKIEYEKSHCSGATPENNNKGETK